MARKRLKQTKAAIAARRRYRAKKMGGGAKKRKKGAGFFLPAMAAMFLPKLLGMGK